MATLGDLKTNISLRLKDANKVRYTDANVAISVNQAIRFWKRKEFWFNEFEEDIVLAAGSSSFVLAVNPTAASLLNPGGIVIDQNQLKWPLRKVSTQRFDRLNRGGTGRPYCWVYRNNAYEFYFVADQDYDAVVRGVKDYADFATDGSADGNSNDFTNYAQDLIEYEALGRIHGEVLQDAAQAKIFQDAAQREFMALTEFAAEKFSTGELEIHSHLM